jgi:AraC family transcriptional regulator of adaptative response/methylated-DNA-[protein]-cysteine methyltransferase
MTLYRSQFDTPLGPMRAVAGDGGVIVCDFDDRRDFDGRLAELNDAVDRPNVHLLTLRSEMDAYFAGTLRRFTVPLCPQGSEFERRAWDYLLTIPFGQTRTYGQQAKAIATTDATRAVGRANGRNFLAILIPCHRVIAANGELTGYGGGIERKRWLLDHEARLAPAADTLFAQQSLSADSITA